MMPSQVVVNHLTCPVWNYDADLLSKQVIQLLGVEEPGSVFLGNFFVQTTNPETKEEDSTDDWSLRKHWAFAPLLHQEARRYQTDVMIGAEKKEAQPYIAMHLRRNDWKFAHKDTLSGLDEVVQVAAKAAETFGIKAVFVATDIQEDEEAAELSKKMKAAGLEMFMYRPSGKASYGGVWRPGWPGKMDKSLIDYDTAVGI